MWCLCSAVCARCGVNVEWSVCVRCGVCKVCMLSVRRVGEGLKWEKIPIKAF